MVSVLVVAEQSISRRLTWILEEAGHSCSSVRDASEGLRVAASETPDVIVMDGVMSPEPLSAYLERILKLSPQSHVVDITTPATDLSPNVRTRTRLRQPFFADDFLRIIDGLTEPRTSG